MSCLRNVLLHIVVWVKMLVISTQYLFLEAFSPFKRLGEIQKREGEYAVITGGNRGIGWHVVKGLVNAGMKVIVGCRDGPSREMLFDKVAKAGLPSDSVQWVDCDMSSMESVRNFGEKILEKNIPISLLINNAGIMFTDYVVTKDGYESQFAVNYLGHFLLTHLLLPRLKAAGKDGLASRIISVSSSAHRFGWFQLSDLQGKDLYSKPGAYSQSKTAQIMFTRYLDNKMSSENAPVRCYALHPGFINSNLYIQTWWARLLTIAFGCMFRTEAEGGERVLYGALSPNIEDLNGSYLENSQVVKPISLARSVDSQQKLWEITCQLLNIPDFGAEN